jgi:hypothetical protein
LACSGGALPVADLDDVGRVPLVVYGSVAGCLRGLTRWQVGDDAVVIARTSVMVGLRKPT